MPWFETTLLAPGITRFTEPHVHDFFRANLYRIQGRDFDIQLDFGVGVRSLSEVSPATVHPVLAIASLPVCVALLLIRIEPFAIEKVP